MSETTYYGDVSVLEVSRLRIEFTHESLSDNPKKRKAQVLDLLQTGEFDDITDSDTEEYKKVLEIDVHPIEE